MPIARREALILAAAGVAAAAAGALAGVFALQSRSGAAALLNEPLRDLTGAPRRLADWRGQVLVCNFWATWCAPCREEIPLLIAAQQQYKHNFVQFVGIGIDSVLKIVEYAKEMKIDYPLLVAEPSITDTMKKLGNKQSGLPFTVVLDRQGAVAATKLGALGRMELNGIIPPLIG
jgi:thiol-disulfide isomerase/thioredoxin